LASILLIKAQQRPLAPSDPAHGAFKSEVPQRLHLTARHAAEGVEKSYG
jgi:hypothetical protein